MKTTPIPSPHAINAGQSNPQAQADARARAVAKLTSKPAVAPQAPVSNPTQIAPEEVSAITSQVQQTAPEVEAAEQQTAPEAPQKAETTQEDKQRLDNQLGIIARKERQLRAKQQQLESTIKNREEAIKSKEAELAKREQELLGGYISKQKLKTNPLLVLNEEGVTYDDLTQQILNSSPLDPRMEAIINKQSTQLEQLQAKLDAYENSNKTAQEQQKASALKQIRRDASEMVKANPEEYALIQATNSLSDVVDLIDKTYEEEGYVMSLEEALNETESYLTEEADRLARIDKIKRRIATPSAGVKQSEKQPPAPPAQQQSMKTLTNSVGSTRRLSNVERAKLAFEGKLKA
jgi:hypothetical protein